MDPVSGDSEVLAVIIGRAGSKGLPGKNALPLAGRPMVEHTIDDALGASLVDRCLVSTDCPRVAACARRRGVPVIARPPALAGDGARVDDAVRHAVDAAGGTASTVVILYANVPVRPDDLIDRAVRLLLASGADSVQSYGDVGKHHPWWMVRIDGEGRIEPHHENAVDRRQDLPPLLLPDGGVIAVRRACLDAGRGGAPHAFLGRDRRGIVVPAGDVVDVDGPHDLDVAAARLGASGAEAGGVRIGDRPIGPSQPPYVIAELGVNHDGSPARAVELVEAAARAGADAVKLQLFEAERLVSRAAPLAGYQRATGAADPAALLRGLELSAAEMEPVVDAARRRGLHCLVTVFSASLIEAAERLAWDAYKVASPDLVNRPLIEALLATGRPLLLSTGAATLEEVERAAAWVRGHRHVLMQCVSAYPVPDESAQLAALAALQRVDEWALGYSDHTAALDTGALAVAAGARVLEKHLTWDRGAVGPDHATSVDEAGLRQYVRLAHRAHAMLGEPVKRVLDIEQDVRRASRQSLVASRDLPAGARLDRRDLAVKRPGTGLAPDRLESVLHRALRRPVTADTPIREDDLE